MKISHFPPRACNKMQAFLFIVLKVVTETLYFGYTIKGYEMKKIFLSVSVLIISFVLFNSCSDSTSPKDDAEQIDSKILINLREELSPQGRNLMLDCHN